MPCSPQVDAKLRAIMHSIYRACKEVAQEYHTTLAAGNDHLYAAALLLLPCACHAQLVWQPQGGAPGGRRVPPCRQVSSRLSRYAPLPCCMLAAVSVSFSQVLNNTSALAFSAAGANISGFLRVAEAQRAQGAV